MGCSDLSAPSTAPFQPQDAGLLLCIAVVIWLGFRILDILRRVIRRELEVKALWKLYWIGEYDV